MRARDLSALGVESVELAQGLSFVMDTPSLLSVTGYKVLRSQEQGCYVPCVRSRINGHEKLTYLTDGSQTLASYLEGASWGSVQRLLRALVEAVQLVEDNGFLSPQSVLVETNKIYVNASTGSCMLVCLPLMRYPVGGDLEARQSVFELCSTVCAALFGASNPLSGIEQSVEYRTGSLAALRDALLRGPHDAASYGDTSLLVDNRDGLSRDSSQSLGSGPSVCARWRLVSSRVGVPDVLLSSPSTVLGKSSAKVDQVISGNPAISRTHCKLCILSDASLTVEDLNSANGTFVNGARIAPGRIVTVAPGDTLMLANAKFSVLRDW